MKKYLLGLLAVSIMSPLLSIANAQNYSFEGDGNGGYSPDTFTTDGGVISNFNASCPSGERCFFNILGEVDNVGHTYCYLPDEQPCEGVELPAGTYTVGTDDDTDFTSVSFTIGDDSSSSGGGDSDSVLPELSVPSSFTSGITQLVNNFGSTISEWIPIVILVTLGITAIFALFRVVRNYARRSFKG